jgi:hypothetical protein
VSSSYLWNEVPTAGGATPGAGELGGTGGDRTHDQSLKRALLYQLSYRPEMPDCVRGSEVPESASDGAANDTTGVDNEWDRVLSPLRSRFF